MKKRKARVTVSIDAALVRAGTEAVAAGHAESLSAWVNLALTERAAKERRLRTMSEVIAAYESEFGEITAEELAAQERADRQSAVVVRGSVRATKAIGRRSRRRGAA